MKQAEHGFPLPFYKINKNLKIEAYSQEALDLFGDQENLLNIFDEASVAKVKDWVRPEKEKVLVEAHLRPVMDQKQPLTADLAVKWENDLHAEVLLLIKDEKLTKVTRTLNQLRTRLNDTNFELLEEKEKLEEAIEQNNQLSAPFIHLDHETALIPLFGELTEEKVYTIESHLLFTSQQSGVDRLLFDFTAVGDLEREGVQVFINVIHSLFYMGSEVIFIGVRPHHAKDLKDMELPAKVKFMNSLEQAIQRYCLKS
ncbi:STAS domain-containing protein [Halobacillus fulvus]|nr:STAS domain-containing protein [Halobacillus fulvus]